VDVNEYWPDVSPNGKKLAYLSKTQAGIDIWTINTDGTGIRRLTQLNAGAHEINSRRGPRWSPDGARSPSPTSMGVDGLSGNYPGRLLSA
jgi:Tol biopolymer transport system component